MWIYFNIVDFHVVKITDITDKIIPFFIKHRIIGIKEKNMKDFIKVVEMVNKKEHLTNEGLKKN